MNKKKEKKTGERIVSAKTEPTQAQKAQWVADSERRNRIAVGGELFKAITKEASNLYSHLGGANTVSGNRLSVTVRDDGSYIAVLRAWVEEVNKDMVVFGSGDTLASAMKAINASIARGAWKENKPFGG